MTKLLGPQTDVHALGAVLYQAVTGRPPHTEDNFAQLLAHIVGEVPPAPSTLAPDLPRALEAIFRKAMAHHPSGR